MSKLKEDLVTTKDALGRVQLQKDVLQQEKEELGKYLSLVPIHLWADSYDFMLECCLVTKAVSIGEPWHTFSPLFSFATIRTPFT